MVPSELFLQSKLNSLIQHATDEDTGEVNWTAVPDGLKAGLILYANIALIGAIYIALLFAILSVKELDISKEVDAEKKNFLDAYVQGYDVSEYGSFATTYQSPGSWEDDDLTQVILKLAKDRPDIMQVEYTTQFSGMDKGSAVKPSSKWVYLVITKKYCTAAAEQILAMVLTGVINETTGENNNTVQIEGIAYSYNSTKLDGCAVELTKFR